MKEDEVKTSVPFKATESWTRSVGRVPQTSETSLIRIPVGGGC